MKDLDELYALAEHVSEHAPGGSVRRLAGVVMELIDHIDHLEAAAQPPAPAAPEPVCLCGHFRSEHHHVRGYAHERCVTAAYYRHDQSGATRIDCTCAEFTERTGPVTITEAELLQSLDAPAAPLPDAAPLPCPWCGETPDAEEGGDYWWTFCRGTGDCCVSGPIRETRASAVAAWNRVAALAQPKQPQQPPAARWPAPEH